MVPLQYKVSVRIQPQGGCIAGVPGVSRNKKSPGIESKQEARKQQRSRHLVSTSHLLVTESFPELASDSLHA